MRGGAEALMENLVGAFAAAGHRAELVRLPTVWDKERIFDAALAWRMVPIDADLVVAINFPAYFVQHPARSSGSPTSTAAHTTVSTGRGRTSAPTTTASNGNGC